ncbi:gluconokinase [Kitasatospora sp. GAS1066B]
MTGATVTGERRESTARPVIIVVMGVSGSGKSTVGALLAARLGLPFAEGDDFHSAHARAEMAAGRPLGDQDRQPWLASLADWLDQRIRQGGSGVLACSALKRSYRDRLRDGRPQVRLLYLQGSREVIAARLAARRGHFFPARLLESQFDELEEPAPDEHAAVVPLAGTPEQTVDRALAALGAEPGATT